MLLLSNVRELRDAHVQKYLIISFMLILTAAGEAAVLQTNRLENPPHIDGLIDAAEWAVVDSATSFTQLEPFSGEPSSARTVVYIAFDKANLYAAFKCYADPQTIVANVRTRDGLEKSDDHVFLLLDTFGDRRSSLAFAVSPLATQTDFRVADDGRSLDMRWDAEWQAAAQRTDFGWSAEMAIPFSNLKYDQKLQEWGLNIGRVIRANSETAYWSGAMNDDFRISQGGRLIGVQAPPKYSPLKVVPYATLRYDDMSGEMSHTGWKTEAGGDLFYNITPSLTANLTYNPDFATVEGDVYQINMTRWELSFPEKRLFFLEGQELYSTRIKNFYSRRVGDIDYGGKVVGKIDQYNVSAIAVRTAPDQDSGLGAATWGVARIKRDILNSSTLGITAVNKSLDGENAGSISADYVLNLGKSWKLTGQWVSSWPATDDLLKRSAWFVRFAKESNIYHYHIRYSDTGELFRDNVNQTGFVRDDDMRETDTDYIYRWWMKNLLFQYIRVLSKNNIFWNHTGTLRSWYLVDTMRFYLRNRFSLNLLYNNEFKLYEKKYFNHRYQAALGYNTDEWQSIKVSISAGRNYDRDFALAELIAS